MVTHANPSTALDVFKQVRDAIENIIGPSKLTIKSCGTKQLACDEPLDTETGYWQVPQNVSSKPPRWIIQIDERRVPPTARIACDMSGNEFASARTVGYINNRDGSCVVAIFRIVPALISRGDPSHYAYPSWEWLLVLAFDTPLPQGTSGEALTSFRPEDGEHGSVVYGRQKWNIGLTALVKIPVASMPEESSSSTSPEAIAYEEATGAVADLVLHGHKDLIYDGVSHTSVRDLASVIGSLVQPNDQTESIVSIEPKPGLIGIPDSVYRQINAALQSGKRHLILYGPPGSGKTTLAEYVARETSADPSDRDAYEMLTASSSWSSQDLIGGYQPTGPGEMRFVQGALLRNFDKPIVIDELNRCPIDKAMGPLFSVLSGQSTTLPYRVDVKDSNSNFYIILPSDKPGKRDNELAPGARWRLICTLNTVDKSQLGQISYALSRRFAWIKVGVPDDLEGFVAQFVGELERPQPVRGGANPVASMWSAVNRVREIGGAPIIDFINATAQMYPAIDFAAQPDNAAVETLIDALCMFILPLLDGINRAEAGEFVNDLTCVWRLDNVLAEKLDRHVRDVSL